MSSRGSDLAPDELTATTATPQALAATREEAKARVSRGRKLAALGGILAGLASFGAGEALDKIIPAALVAQTAQSSNQPVMGPTPETEKVAAVKNAALAFGALGLCLGGFLGIAGGLARRSTFAAVTGGLLGASLAAIVGAGVSLALLPRFLAAQTRFPQNELIISVSMHGLIWGLVGASAGLAFAGGLGERRVVGGALAGGLVGAVLGAVAFDMIGAAFFEAADTLMPISETWPTRLMARLLVTIGTATALVFFLLEPRDAVARHQADIAAPSPEP